MYNKLPTKFSFTWFNVTKERAIEIMTQMLTHLVTHCICECGYHLNRENTIPYIRSHAWEWTENIDETNYLYYELGKTMGSVSSQITLLQLKKDTIKATTIAVKEHLESIVNDTIAPLN